MKKLFFITGITLLLLLVILGSLYVIDHKRMDSNEPVVFSTWGKQYTPLEITPQTAIENAKEKLDPKSIKTITNYDNPKIEEVVFDTPPWMYYFEDKKDIVGKGLYKITFYTTQDGLLGPIVIYVDKLSGELIGIEYRE